MVDDNLDRKFNTPETKEKSAEKSDSSSSVEQVDTGDSREGIGAVLSVESAESAEGVEVMNGPAEKARRGPGEQGGSGMPAGKGDDGQQGDDGESAFVKQLKASKPAKNMMVKQVRSELHKKIKVLMKDAQKHKSQGDFHAYSNSIAEIRENQSILARMAKLTYEALKNVWMKVMHGVA